MAPPIAGRRPPGPTAKPAAVVFGIILAIFLVGFVADAITSSHTSTPTPAGRPVVVAGTGGLVAESGGAVLDPIVSSSGPPTDILDATLLPRGSQAVPGSASNHALGLYDSTLTVQIPAAEQATITFFKAELAAGKWHVVSSGTDGAGYRFIAQHPSSDGYEWELGVTLSATAFRSQVPGDQAPPGGVTPTVIRLFQMSDFS